MNKNIQPTTRILSMMVVLLSILSIHANPRYCARYIKQHLLYQAGQETNVIDIDLEWPEFVDGTPAIPLQRMLTRTLLGNERCTLDSAYTQFLSRFGSPVTRQFDVTPDDSRFCYVTCNLKLIGHQDGKYISMRANYICQPEKNSTQKGDTVSMLLTYDLRNAQILRLADLLRTNRLQQGYYTDDAIYQLLAGAQTPLPKDIYTLQINDACLSDDALMIEMSSYDGEQITPITSKVAPEHIKGITTKAVRKLLTDTGNNTFAELHNLPAYINGDTIYSKADQAPEFNFNGESLMNYLIRNLRLDVNTIQQLPSGSRAVIAFVVNTQGYILHTRVVGSVNAEIDRELIRTARLMPAWTPGSIGGKPVNVWCMLPIVLKK